MAARQIFEEPGVDTHVDALTAQIEREASELAAQARKSGRILTIEQVSVAPRAAGRHVDVISVRRARKPGGQY